MRRGEVFTASLRGPPAKPRPFVIMHADEFIRTDGSVIVCPLTSELSAASSIRVRIDPTPENGLRHVSEVMVDRLAAAFERDIGRSIGRLAGTDIARIECAIINVLALGQAASVILRTGDNP